MLPRLETAWQAGALCPLLWELSSGIRVCSTSGPRPHWSNTLDIELTELWCNRVAPPGQGAQRMGRGTSSQASASQSTVRLFCLVCLVLSGTFVETRNLLLSQA